MSPSRPEYAIIGGGITGLTLAIALYRRNIPVTIYEQAQKFGEIGAGVAFTANALQAMKVCDKGIYQAFEKVATKNGWPSKRNVWFEYLDGTKGAGEDPSESGHQKSEFVIKSPVGNNGVHRARFLDGMVELVPENIAKFGKQLDTLLDLPDGRVQMRFRDGTTAEADAVIGCDGIKSRVRHQILGGGLGSDKVYSHKYAYRGLIDMDKAIEAVGEERAVNGCMWMGQNRHVLTFPVNHGKTMNLVAFVTTPNDWPDYSRTTLPAKREEAIRDYEGFGPNVMKLLHLCTPELDTASLTELLIEWSIFDLFDHPLKSFSKGRVCLVGDAAHASSPHHGAGAGMGIEDAAVLASLLADPSVTGEPGVIETVFETYSTVRKPRGQWLVEHSRRQGDLYEWRAEGVGKNFSKIEHEIIASNFYIEHVDVQELCEDAKLAFREKLSSSSGIKS